MTGKTIRPISALVRDVSDYLANVATPAVEAVRNDPASPHKAIAAFIILHHVQDWANQAGHDLTDKYWKEFRFAQVISEIANGGKHSEVKDPRLTEKPAVLEFRLCHFGEGGYGVGPFGVSNIQVHCRLGDGEPTFHAILSILVETLDWWNTNTKDFDTKP
jgi:hypothetical protein